MSITPCWKLRGLGLRRPLLTKNMITAWICALRNGADAMVHGSLSELSTMPAMDLGCVITRCAQEVREYTCWQSLLVIVCPRRVLAWNWRASQSAKPKPADSHTQTPFVG